MVTDALALVGRLGCNRLRVFLDKDSEEHGTARLVLHRLGVDEVAAIAVAVSRDPDLATRVEILLPRYKMADALGVEDSWLTDMSTTEVRTAACSKEARLFALFDVSQEQSLAQVEKINKDVLLDAELADEWVAESIAGMEFPLTTSMRQQWVAAVKGMFQLDRLSLRDAAQWLCLTRDLLREGLTVRKALGKSLWVLRLPSFANAFDSIQPEQKLNYPSEWRKKFASHWTNQSYLFKRNKQQVPYTRQSLEDAFVKTQDTLLESVRSAIRTFIDAEDGWTPESERLSRLDWDDVRPFFEGTGKTDPQTLGARTKKHFRLLDPETVLPADWSYIEGLVERGTKPVKDETDERFYFDHRMDLQQDPSLTASWERFIFGSEVSCTDLTVGLLDCIRRLLPAREEIDGPVLVEVTAEESEKIKFKLKNEAACRYFQARYSGLQNTLAPYVEFRKVLAFNYEAAYADLQDAKGFRPESTAKAALQLSFRVVLKSADDETRRTSMLRLTWAFEAASVLSGFHQDLLRLSEFAAKRKKPPLLRCQANREESNVRNHNHPLSLSDVSGFAPGRSERGAFLPAVSKCHDLGKDWATALGVCLDKHYIDGALAELLKAGFDTFASNYEAAIQQMNGGDTSSALAATQAEQYGALLHAVATRVTADEARRLLLRPLLEVGVASVGGPAGCDPVAVVCPWHPLRIYSAASRMHRLKSVLAALLQYPTPQFADGSGELYFKEATEMLEDAGSPEIVLDWRGAEPVLLATTDHLHDYTLHESPVPTGSRSAGTNEDPRYTAGVVAEVVDSYLTLQPHERDSFSIVLYNCDSAALPQAVVESVRATGEHEAHDAMCQIILTHSDRRRLRQLYQGIASQDGEDEAFHVSESSRDFMARVRINIMVDEAPEPDPRSGQPADVVFCHDVISRHAELSWARASRVAATFSADALQPHQWARRREMQRGDRESVVYLACPAQTEVGWRYYLAAALLCEPEFAIESWNAGFCQLPARRLNFDKAETNHIFRQTHALGNWVVNLDELLDRRLLRDRDIRVIRYRQTTTQGRSLIISSNASDALLRATIQNKLRPLLPDGHPPQELASSADKFIGGANEISGQLVLRAAKRGSSTNELLGLVLSSHLVRHELGPSRDLACFLLDDYATWLGQTEDRIADLMILSPSFNAAGEKLLDVIVTEAKFVRADQLAAKARESSKQLRDSLQRLERALLSDVAPVDQDIWLSRLSDMLIDGLHDRHGAGALDLPAWRSAIRRKEVRVCLRGYSHVFVHGPADDEGASDRYTRVPDTMDGHQECFSRSTLRMILRGFLGIIGGEANVTGLRRSLAGHDFAARTYSSITGGNDTGGSAGESRDNDPGSGGGKGGPSPAPRPSTDAPAARDRSDSPDRESAPTSTEGSRVNDATGAASPLIKSLAADAFRRVVDGARRVTSETAQDAEALQWLEETGRRTKVALQKRNMTAKLLEQRLTPNAALLKFQGTNDLTIAKAEARLSEFKTTDGLDIIAVRAELGRVAIAIARPRREILHLQDVWQRWRPNVGSGNTSLLIGVKEDDNDLLFLSPDPQPHTLVAGWTGSGKSVLMQNIILGIAATNTPAEAQLVLIDPKQAVDYFAFEGLPHFVAKPITAPEAALEHLQGLVGEMKRRYHLLREARVPNIGQYLKKTGKVLPRLWVIHDEFAVWMQDESYRDNVTSLVNQLSVEARASGIYLIFAAQRPDVTVLPMQLRSNLGNRLVLRVDTEATSDIALGIRKGGAERLLGNGHLAALCGGASVPVYAQVPFISEDDLTHLVTTICDSYRQYD
ncbi:MAG TPA: FtsK/SpoIIIE domain-containing protein [Phycisphaerae bacterium]|nr:FtsK/SpoIIIE domain-containing protein [Phycisphaerae bacterium]